MCDDAVFVASCIAEAIQDEIRWPSVAERLELARSLNGFGGCIAVEVRRPHNDPVDHNGLFIHIDEGYAGSFHDVNILRHSEFLTIGAIISLSIRATTTSSICWETLAIWASSNTLCVVWVNTRWPMPV